MKAVGVKELKARLSEYLRAVRRGETVLVTDRDQVIAELRPARSPAARDSVEDVLQTLADSGQISRARLTRTGWQWRPRGLGLPPGTAAQLLDAVRAERRS